MHPHDGLALQWASTELQSDYDVVVCAIAGASGNGRGIALEFAGPALRADTGLVIQAISNDAWAIQFASEDLRRNKDIALLAPQSHGLVDRRGRVGWRS